MPSFEFATGTLALPAWAAGAAVALFAVIGVLTLTRAGAGFAGATLRVALVFAGFAAVWMALEQGMVRERSAERRALDQRAADLATRAVAPGSPLACLDAIAGDAVESACEKAVFASPASVATAVSYMTARLALLSDAVDFARRNGGYDSALTTLRLPVESDRYGVVAHVLSVRESCTPLLCDSYTLLRDPDRVQANLRERKFDRYVERYAADWARAQAAGTPVVEAPAAYTTASGPPAAPATAAATAAVPLASKYDFPSAASIPPVSIMSPEPTVPPEVKQVPAAPAAAPAAPSRRSQHAAPAPHAPARAATVTPQQIAPAPAPAPAAPAAAVR
jgi:hypothetical protein